MRLRAEGVDQERHGRILDSFEEQGRSEPLADPIGDLGDLENRIDLGRDPPQQPPLLQRRDKSPQILVCHGYAPSFQLSALSFQLM